MNKLIQQLKLFWADTNLRSKFLFTIGIFFVYRAFVYLPIPAINAEELRALFADSQLLSFLNIFSGGTLLNFSVMALGLNPYINASIIMQLLTVVVPQLESLQKEGDYGRQKINQYTRLLTLPLTILQAIGIYVFMQNQGVISELTFLQFISFVFTLVAGTYILVWLGELISEKGLGNGISLIIFAGIAGTVPPTLLQSFGVMDQGAIISVTVLITMALGVIASVVFVNQAVRRVPVYYAKRIKGNKMYQGQTNYLPLKLNQAGVIPIIFAVSFMLFPQIIASYFLFSDVEIIRNVATFFTTTFNPSSVLYNLFYFVLVVMFTFFYTVVVFNPQRISEDIQKQGGFIPGIRPGEATKQYLSKVVYRITTAGALFLGIIAILPVIISGITGITNLIIGGTSILIVVTVILETFKVIEAQLVMKSYDRYNR